MTEPSPAEKAIEEALAQQQREFVAANKNSELQNEIKRLSELVDTLARNVRDLRHELSGDDEKDGLRVKVRQHDRVLRRLMAMLSALTLGVATAIGAWVWGKMSA